MAKKSLTALGLMTGTSLDGLDLCLMRASPEGTCRQIGFGSRKFPKALAAKLRQAVTQSLSMTAIADLHFDLGRFYAKAAGEFVSTILIPAKIDVVGLHGQTVYHHPPHSTWQIGESSFLSSTLKCPVISDFRSADLAVGGHGAPLAPAFHARVLKTKPPYCIHNLGGISNVTLIGNRPGQNTAFDTGPANMLLDVYIQELSQKKSQYDKNGALARRGQINSRLLQLLLKHKFLQRKPPKSCGREEFGLSFLKSQLEFLADEFGADTRTDQNILATLTEFTAVTISNSYRKFLPVWPKAAFFCGGGALNTFLMERLSANLNAIAPIDVYTTSKLGWHPQVVESAAFAYLACLNLWRQPGNSPAFTGADRAVILGKSTRL